MCVLDCDWYTHPSCGHKVLVRTPCRAHQLNPNGQNPACRFLRLRDTFGFYNQKCDLCQAHDYNRDRVANGMMRIEGPGLINELMRRGTNMGTMSDANAARIMLARERMARRRAQGKDEDNEYDNPLFVPGSDFAHRTYRPAEFELGDEAGDIEAIQHSPAETSSEEGEQLEAEIAARRQTEHAEQKAVMNELQANLEVGSTSQMNVDKQQATANGVDKVKPRDRLNAFVEHSQTAQVHPAQSMDSRLGNSEEGSPLHVEYAEAPDNELDKPKEELKHISITLKLFGKWRGGCFFLEKTDNEVITIFNDNNLVFREVDTSTIQMNSYAMPDDNEQSPTWKERGKWAVEDGDDKGENRFRASNGSSAPKQIHLEPDGRRVEHNLREVKPEFWNPHTGQIERIRGPIKATAPPRAPRILRQPRMRRQAGSSKSSSERNSTSDEKVHMRGGDDNWASKQVRRE